MPPLTSYTPLQEGLNLGDWLAGEQTNPTWYSRDQVTVVNGTGSTVTLPTGTVLGKITSSGNFTQLAPGASDGSQTACAVLGPTVTIPASSNAVVWAITRAATVKDIGLTYPSGITTNQIATAVQNLAAAGIGIIARRTA